MTGDHEETAANAWLVVEPDRPGSELRYPQFALELRGERKLYAAVGEGDWVLFAAVSGQTTRVGRVLRVRSDMDRTAIYFDHMLFTHAGSALVSAGLRFRTAVR